MMLPFQMGVGGALGDGKQWMSWVSLSDAVCAVHHLLMRKDLKGAFNITAPNPVSNQEFTKTLAAFSNVRRFYQSLALRLRQPWARWVKTCYSKG